MRIHARVVSLGGGILLAVSFALAVLLVDAFTSPNGTRVVQLLLLVLCGAVVVYLLDSASETLELRPSILIFDSWLKRRRRIDLMNLEAVLLVHEGLNLEKGIESLVFRGVGGEEDRLSLGPLWHRHELESLLHRLEETVGREHLLEEVR